MLKSRYIPSLLLAVGITFGAEAQLTFTGSTLQVINEKPAANTGLDMVYVVANTSGVKASYKAVSPNVTWQRYSNLGGGYAEEIAATSDGNGVFTISLGSDDMGYIIEDGTTRHYYWVVNYANHVASLDGLDIAPEQDCDRAMLKFSGHADRITYYSINGNPKDLSRDLILSYHTLQYDEDDGLYAQIEASETYPSLATTIGVRAPYCDTNFTLSGDKFQRIWGMEHSVTSPQYKAIAVEAQTTAEQETRENDNEQKVEATLGGSAPVVIDFHAEVTDAAIFREWQMTKDPSFEVVDDRFNTLDLNHTFRDNGTTYVRFVANNAEGTCEYIGQTYEVFIGESTLLCPNAFSPGNDDGVNDEWKVSYKSIISFECHIFNRWGQEMASFTDPSEGWDGKYRGKVVPTGVYYYVIKAEGSDGKKYNLSGDINIIRSRIKTGSGSEGSDTQSDF